MISLILRAAPTGALIALLAHAGVAQRALPRPIPPRWDFAKLVYYSDASGANGVSVGRATLSATFETALADDSLAVPFIRGISVDRRNGHVYVPVANPGGGVLRMDTTGGNQVIVRPETFAAIAVTLDPVGERLYYLPGNGAIEIKSCLLDGSDPKELVHALDLTPSIVALDIHVDGANRRLYWYDANYRGFRMAVLTSTGDVSCVKDLFMTGIQNESDFDPVNQMLYWVPNGGRQILRVPVPPDGMDPCAPPASVATPELFVEHNSAVTNINSMSVLPVTGNGGDGVVAWSHGNGGLRWRNLKGTWPAPVYDSGRLSMPSVLTSMELVNGPVTVFR